MDPNLILFLKLKQEKVFELMKGCEIQSQALLSNMKIETSHHFFRKEKQVSKSSRIVPIVDISSKRLLCSQNKIFI